VSLMQIGWVWLDTCSWRHTLIRASVLDRSPLHGLTGAYSGKAGASAYSVHAAAVLGCLKLCTYTWALMCAVHMPGHRCGCGGWSGGDKEAWWR
jgi:hypothetical protein